MLEPHIIKVGTMPFRPFFTSREFDARFAYNNEDNLFISELGLNAQVERCSAHTFCSRHRFFCAISCYFLTYLVTLHTIYKLPVYATY